MHDDKRRFFPSRSFLIDRAVHSMPLISTEIMEESSRRWGALKEDVAPCKSFQSELFRGRWWNADCRCFAVLDRIFTSCSQAFPFQAEEIDCRNFLLAATFAACDVCNDVLPMPGAGARNDRSERPVLLQHRVQIVEARRIPGGICHGSTPLSFGIVLDDVEIDSLDRS